jgi:hypothetical protein
MSVAPNAGVVDLDNFLPPTAGTDGVQGQVPKPLAGEQDYVLTASGWVALSSLGTLIFQGTWDASTNTPTLTSSVGTAGYYYVVSVAGNTDLNGITTWTVGDWALFNGTVWQKIEGGSTVDITGGQINNTVIGNNTPAAGTFTTLTSNTQTNLSSIVNIRNGGTVTAVTLTSSGNNYTSIPSCAISAPTTAGGVQAAVTIVMFSGQVGVTVASGGTGYTVGDTLTVIGGTFTTQATYTVATVSGGVVLTVTRTAGAGYSVLPTNPVSTTGGTGTGATLNLTWTVGNPIISNAGSGYVEQPTITFSGGGGGSGAAAYASVGAGTVVRSLGSTMSFYTPAGESFRVAQSSTYGTSYFTAVGSAITASLISSGSNAIFGNSGAGVLQFITNNANEQFRVAHTASAVNYVQVTGAATGNAPTISAQGSDGTVALTLTSKGAANINFLIGGGTRARVNSDASTDLAISGSGGVGFKATGVTSQVNFIQATGAIAGSAPILSAQGSDTNIDLTLTPKGTGGVTQTVNGGSLTTTRNSAINMMKVTAANVQNLALQATGGGSVYLKTGDDTSTQFVAAFTASAVNFLQAAGSVTGSGVTLSAQGSDTNIDINLVPKGTGTTIYTGGVTVNGPFTATGQTSLGGVAGSEGLRVNVVTSSVNYVAIQGDTSISPKISAAGAGANVNLLLSSKGVSGIGLYSNGFAQQQFLVSHTASAVNYVQVTGSATGNNPTISSQGSDATRGLAITTKGASGVLDLQTGGTSRIQVGQSGTGIVDIGISASGGIGFQVSPTTSQVNYFSAAGGVTTKSPVISAAGSDTNISQVFQSKGTGAIDLAAGSSGVNISNGGTVTAITSTNPGSAYTAVPTVNITAPTTAGGVQAVITTNVGVNAGTIGSGGTGYTLGDTLTLVGGTTTGGASTWTVSGVSGGVVTAVTNATAARYTAFPSLPASVTGGTGSGFNFSVVSGFVNQFVISNAGSGYVEQPTVSFSGGGGGSAAAAYATVGSGTTVKGLGTNIDFYTSNPNIGFRVYDSGLSGNAYWAAQAGGAGPFLWARGGTNIDGRITSSGTGSVQLYTNSGSQEQMRVAHTASAVNYVQVTGAVAGGRVTISSQGSDTNVPVVIGTKGSGSLNVRTNDSVTTQFAVTSTASAVNYINVTGATTTNAPVISALGTDTNVDLNLTTKGTGVVNFNTGNGTQFRVADTFAGGTATNYIQVQGRATFQPVLSTAGASTNISLQISTKGTGDFSVWTNEGAQQQFAVTHTASAVNYVQVTGAATGGTPIISAQGSDTNTGMLYYSKGFGSHQFRGYNGANIFGQFFANQASPVNYIEFGASSSGNAILVRAAGADTNIPLVLQPKGTGALQAQQTDSTATGGNARGANAVDWQTSRSSASMVASGTYATLGGGINNTVSGFGAAILGGGTNTASVTYGAIGGGTSNNVGSYSYLGGGQSNSGLGYFNFVGGGFTNTGTSSSAVTTQSATMNATTAVALSGSNVNIKVGQLITGTSIASWTYVAAISGTSLTLSQAATGSSTSTLSFYTPHGVVVGGGNNQATGSYSFIGGGGDAGTAANRNVASGAWSSVVGGFKTTASGLWSFAGGGGGNTASGEASVVAGGGSYGGGLASNTASGTSSFAGSGYGNASGGYCTAVVGGSSNGASNNFAFVGAGASNTANGANSAIMGGTSGSTRSITGNHIFPACNQPIASTLGITQSGLLLLARQTTDATATVLTSESGVAGSTNQVILPNNSAYFFKGTVVAGVTGGGDTKGWTIEGVIKRGANAASTAIVGTATVTSSYADAGAATWAIAVTADTTNGGLAVTFTGQLATTIRVVCKIETTEMTF